MQTQEDIRHVQKLRDLEDEFEVQGTFTRLQYQELIDAKNRLHALKRKNTEAEANQADQAKAASETVRRRHSIGALADPAAS